ncbi:MAG: FAD:protein FMN transferase [Candidatus Omnitrophica bacterium]|nr:FAD:protein FMN transferase [Candidatus Omnitrophota bacterium]
MTRSLKLIFIILLLCGCQDQKLYKSNRIIMGTIIEVTSADSRAANIAFDAIKKIDQLLSKYNPESEASKLNLEGQLYASSETFYIIKRAKEFHKITNGAFDVSVGPLLDLWGFTEKEYRLPKAEEIRRTLELVGSDKIVLNQSDNMVKFMLLGMKIDLGAIAKGYAIDYAVAELKKSGITSCLINAGGDIYCLGSKFGKPWHVAIKDPRGFSSPGTLELKDRAVATSGDYEQYFFENSKRYAHIFNPETGYPVESGVVSVTVVASDCLTADFLATSIMVLGKDKGKELAARFPEVQVQIIEERDV